MKEFLYPKLSLPWYLSLRLRLNRRQTVGSSDCKSAIKYSPFLDYLIVSEQKLPFAAIAAERELLNLPILIPALDMANPCEGFVEVGAFCRFVFELQAEAAQR
jgi:hypothetical protein